MEQSDWINPERERWKPKEKKWGFNFMEMK